MLMTLGLLVAPLAAPSTTPSADAAVLFLTTNIDQTGYGEATGHITFPSRYRVKISELWVQDRCGSRGGDGRGIYLRGRIATRSNAGVWRRHSMGVIGYDNNGCGNSPMYFDVRRWTKDHKIFYVELWLCEEDRDDSGTRCLTSSGRETYRNPRL